MLDKSLRGAWLRGRVSSIVDLRSISGGRAWSALRVSFGSTLLITPMAAYGLVVAGSVCVWFVRACGCWLLLVVGAVSGVWRSSSPSLSP
ncbi:hypothetical protein Bca4012_010641 [Brassica carinata]|uniref:Uncharacterized protein n=1 Tax=Brassica carinata TaxID=52824 RepID=A0A8X7S3W7_BRACI|nr:hypothetical protein Bca52824_035553 [Brassica carinata]